MIRYADMWTRIQMKVQCITWKCEVGPSSWGRWPWVLGCYQSRWSVLRPFRLQNVFPLGYAHEQKAASLNVCSFPPFSSEDRVLQLSGLPLLISHLETLPKTHLKIYSWERSSPVVLLVASYTYLYRHLTLSSKIKMYNFPPSRKKSRLS